MTVTEIADPPGIVLAGEIDFGSAATLRTVGERLTGSLAAGGRLPVDVAEVTFLDSSGVGALIAVRNAAAASGGSVIIRNLSQPVRRMFELSGLMDTFPLELDPE
jgi:anti-sigma B factor antagonist